MKKKSIRIIRIAGVVDIVPSIFIVKISDLCVYWFVCICVRYIFGSDTMRRYEMIFVNECAEEKWVSVTADRGRILRRQSTTTPIKLAVPSKTAWSVNLVRVCELSTWAHTHTHTRYLLRTHLVFEIFKYKLNYWPNESISYPNNYKIKMKLNSNSRLICTVMAVFFSWKKNRCIYQ